LGPERGELARAIHRETEGNAFFVREVVRHLVETGEFQEREGRWGITRPVEQLGIPEGVREVVGQRLTRLSETTNHVLAIAAVIGEDFELPVLERCGRLNQDTLVAALDDAVAARLIIEIPGHGSRYQSSPQARAWATAWMRLFACSLRRSDSQ
jgi:predicted ATPase